jgi:hypothetical protein
MPGLAFPPVGPVGFGSPRSSVLFEAKTAYYSSRITSLVARESVPCGIPMIRSLSDGGRMSTPGLLSQPAALDDRRVVVRETTGSPKFPSYPYEHMPRP